MLNIGPRVVLKIGPSFILLFHCFPHFYSVLGILKNTKSVHLSQNSVFFCKIVGMSKMRFSKKKLHFLFLFFLCCCKRNRKNGKKKLIKIVFLLWSSKHDKMKNGFFFAKLA